MVLPASPDAAPSHGETLAAPLAGREPIPALDIAVTGAGAVAYAAVPTLAFELTVTSVPAVPVRSVLLDVQLQIAARRRAYQAGEQARLGDLFGTPERWSTTLRTLPWTRVTLVVPAFSGTTRAELPVPASYDLEVTSARYFAALSAGEVPLEFLFSGSLFYTSASGALQTARIAWDREAAYRLPVAVWRDAVERHFPDSGWLRLTRRNLDRLLAHKSKYAYTSFDALVEALLDAEAR